MSRSDDRTPADVAAHVPGLTVEVGSEREAFADLADRYRMLVELSPDAICVHEGGRVVYVNPAAMEYSRAKTPDDIIGRFITDFVHPDSIPEMVNRLLQLTTTGSATAPSEAIMLRCDGEPVESEVVSVRTLWEGRPAFQVIMRDVSVQKAAETALRFKAALVESVSDAIIATSADGVVTSWNPAAEVIYGRTAEETIGLPVADVVGAELDPKEIIAAGGIVESTHVRTGGAPVEVRISAAESDGGYVLVCADETSRRRAQQRFSTVVTSLHEGVVVVGASGYVELANPAAGRIFGKRADSLIGLPILDLVLFDRRGGRVPEADHPILETLRTGSPRAVRSYQFDRADGKRLWLSISCRPLDPEEPHAAVVASFADITEQTIAGDRLRYEASHDSLTGLANRSTVIAKLDTALRRSVASSRIAVHFIDIDQFKLINDSLGHSTGDDVLRIAADRLRRAVRASDVVGRLGGDEFVVVSTASQDREAVSAQAERLRAVLSEPMAVNGRQLHVDASIGIVLAEGVDRRSSADLLRDADIAMYQAKTGGRGRCRVFTVEMRERIQRRLQLEQDLRTAQSLGNLWVAYQPIVDLRSMTTIAVEGLLRWSHPVFGPVPPNEFIPLAEQSDLINVVGNHVLTVGSAELAVQRGRSHPTLELAVNLSAAQSDDPRLVATIQDTLRRSALPANSLCVEITESALMREPEATGATLRALRNLGVRLAIDDFGTGYSSFAQLQRLPLDILKIGQPLVAELGTSKESQAIVTSIIAMAHATGLVVVAEGIETTEQLDILTALGCDHGQGYLLGRPVTAADLFDAAPPSARVAH